MQIRKSRETIAPLSEEKALEKLKNLCAKAEHCTGEMYSKLKTWGIKEEGQERIVTYLIKNRYVDDERFVRLFIKDKIKFSAWGEYKIGQALYSKGLNRSFYEPFLAEIDNEEYKKQLIPLLRKKVMSIKAKNDYERSGKLLSFAVSRGYSIDLIKSCIEDISDVMNEDW